MINLQDQSAIDCIAATPIAAAIVTAATTAETTITAFILIVDLISILSHLAACSI